VDEMRFQKMEQIVAKHGSKLREHEKRHQEQELVNEITLDGMESLRTLVAATQQSIIAHQQNTSAAIRLTEKIERLADALGVLGTFAKWVLAISGLCGLIVATVKGLRL